MKALVKWIVKRCVSRDILKTAIHAMNEELAKKKLDERRAKVMDVANDVAEVTAAYCNAFSDGEMTSAELVDVNAKCDATVDKYIDANVLEKVVEAVIK